MGKGNNAPAVPDPTKLVQQATQSNIDTAIAQSTLNNVNQTSPFGSTQFTYKPGENGQAGTWSNNTTLTPALQSILNKNFATQGTVANAAGNAASAMSAGLNKPLNAPTLGTVGSGPQLNTTGGTGGPIKSTYASGGPIRNSIDGAGTVRNTIADAGQIQSSLGTNDYSADRQRVEDALMGRLNTQIGKDRQAHEASLANRGIRLGSQAYSDAMQNFDRGVAENRTSAILGAAQEQNRLQDLALNAGNFTNAAQAQQYGQNANNAAFANAAQSQLFGQNTTQAQFANTAQQQQTDQNAQAAAFGNTAQQQQFAQSLANSQFGNTAQQQMYDNASGAVAQNNQTAQTAFGNDITTRNQLINQLMSLMGGSQVQNPQFQQTGGTGVAGTDVAGISQNAYNQQYQQYAQQQQQQQGLLGGLMGLGGSALGAAGLAGGFGTLFSDKRLKTDIKATGEKIAGVPVKTWKWKGSGQPDVGVIAQEVSKRHPDLVDNSHPSGFKRVDYNGLMRLGATAMKEAA